MTLLATDPTEMLGGAPADVGYTGTPGQVSNPTIAPGTTSDGAAGSGASSSTNTTTANTANASIDATLNSMGLGGMVSWATNLVSTLAGQGVSTSDIVNTVISQLNSPTTNGLANGPVDQGALAAFNAALPGFNQLIQNTGSNGSPGATPEQAIANYINYSTQIQQFSTQAGLLPGTVTPQTIGNLWANQVSSSEVSQRVTDATTAAANAPDQVKDYIAQNFPSMSGTAALSSYYLNPTNTLSTITQNLNTAMVGGEAAITGFDNNLSVAQAQALGAFLANGVSGASGSSIGQVNQITAGQVNNAFTSNLGGGIQGSAAELAGLQTATPGQNAGSTVTENELLSAMGVPGQGSTQAQALIGVSNAQQARTAGSRGGGGATTTSEGAVGLGYAQSA